MTIVAIHQPNYAPWLGYFHKIVHAEVFIFLDNAAYSKNSYINRVQIDGNGVARWLTVPVSYQFGDSICNVRPARSEWRTSHLDTLKSYYRKAAAFAAVWPTIRRVYERLPDGDLSQSNRALTETLAQELGLKRTFLAASDIETSDLTSDDRLVALVKAVAPDGTYLSGKGGQSYQNPAKFAAAGIRLVYSGFEHPVYDQGRGEFIGGLSVLDAIFRVGFANTARLIG